MQDTGPACGPPLIMIHGATVPHWSFERLIPYLSAAGFRVICFDLYGHGRSDTPAAEYTVPFFQQQTRELLSAMSLQPPLSVLGYSLGAAVAAELCRLNPEMVEKLILVAPLWNFSDYSRWSTAISRPIIGPFVLKHIAMPALRFRRGRRYRRLGLGHLGVRFNDESRDRGLSQAIVSMERNGTLGSQRARYTALGRFGGLRLIVSALEDRIAPPDHIEQVRSLIQPCHSHTLSGLEHNLMLTAPEQVSQTVTTFLRQPFEIP